MQQTIYSGYYTHNKQTPSWAQRALIKQAHWCQQTNHTYTPLNDMSKWSQYYPHPHSWGFGSLIKILAIEHFINTEESMFVWMDMDVYPTLNAYIEPLPPPNAFNYNICNYNHQPKRTKEINGVNFDINKQTWVNTNAEKYYNIRSGFMILDRPTTMSIWGFINKTHHINTKQWWDEYYQRQLTIDHENPWDYGNDEAILEEWLNKVTPTQNPNLLPLHIHACDARHKPNFMHYHSNTKDQYPYN